MADVHDSCPVLVGAGVASQRPANPLQAKEPLRLMEDALRTAAIDSTVPEVLSRLDWILVPKGRWRYRDPGRALAEAVGAQGARSALAHIGVLQSTLIGRACEEIAAGRIRVAAVVGGEAGARIRSARLANVDLSDTVIDGEADDLLSAAEEIYHPAEVAAQMTDAVVQYALLDSAYRHASGLTAEQGREADAELYSRFSEIASANPHAWRQDFVSPDQIRVAAPQNPMLAFPYTRSHVSSWSVDQAGALLLCSAKTARDLGVPQNRWIFPRVNAESNVMMPVFRRGEPHRSLGAEAAGSAAVEHCGIDIADVDLLELYSCFPVAVRMFARALGIDTQRDLTTTGGMAFAGGPLNNYVIQSTCRMVELLRTEPGSATGLVTAVSGFMTKQGVTVWSTEAGPRSFIHVDVSRQVACRTPSREAATSTSGPVTVVATTVDHTRGEPRAVAIVETEEQVRGIVTTHENVVVAGVEAEDWVGRQIDIDRSWHRSGR